MSASLVGSEMCIRDRRLQVAAQAAAQVARAASVQAHLSDVGRQRRTAVSYTHLTLPTICSV
eukprot:14688002-Alexandrium_andersonii.AAC.1